MQVFAPMLAALLMMSLSTCSVASEAQSPPNIIIVLVDDLGYADVGCFGSVYYETPNIDRLAVEGMRFTDGYASAAICSPTRAAMMTGRYPARLGITDWIRPLAGQEWTEAQIRARPSHQGGPNRKMLAPVNPRWMERDEITIAELLKDAGYATGFIGKWHLGPPGWFPEDQGFDENDAGCDFGHPPSYFDPYPADHQRESFPNLPARKAGEYLTDREADEAETFIRTHASAQTPFFLALCHYAVHSPIRARADLIEHYENKQPPDGDGQNFPTYAAMVHSVDLAMGQVLDTLDELNLTENTIVIFTSDNGGATHFRATDNRPLRSGKGRPWEGGIRVPLIVRWPARIQAGTTSARPVASMDVLPTLCEAVGVSAPDDRVIDGESFLPTLAGEAQTVDRTLYWHFPQYWMGGRLRPYSIIRDGDWKLIRWYEDGRIELYNLGDDLSEAHDLVQTHPNMTRQLEAKLDQWLESVNAKMAKPNPSYEGDS